MDKQKHDYQEEMLWDEINYAIKEGLIREEKIDNMTREEIIDWLNDNLI